MRALVIACVPVHMYTSVVCPVHAFASVKVFVCPSNTVNDLSCIIFPVAVFFFFCLM